MHFTIIIPTRNRPNELNLCLNHIFLQTFTDYEVLIVDDGSHPKVLEQYAKIIPTDKKFKLINQGGATLKGQGVSITRNIGLTQAQGEYITFCDDDDFWTDDNHLLIAYSTLIETDIDMYIANQISMYPNGEIKYKDWFPHWSNNIDKYKTLSKTYNIYSLKFNQIFYEKEIPQLNTLIIKTTICKKIDGFWPLLLNLEDRDFYLRALEYTHNVCYRKDIVSQHNSPATAKRESLSNGISQSERQILMVTVLNHVIANTNRTEIILFCKKFLGEEYRDLTLSTKNQSQAIFSHLALTSNFTTKWFAFTMYLKLKLAIKHFFQRNN